MSSFPMFAFTLKSRLMEVAVQLKEWTTIVPEDVPALLLISLPEPLMKNETYGIFAGGATDVGSVVVAPAVARSMRMRICHPAFAYAGS